MYAYFIFNTGILVRVVVDEEGDYESAEAYYKGQFHPASELIPDILMKGGVTEITEAVFRDYQTRRGAAPSAGAGQGA
ncbi:MAG: hypothetical protein KDC18_03080 [Alphaproteobacteria bacterium]|nr:hypothetical protein [Alphaproteobacteria bacterium]